MTRWVLDHSRFPQVSGELFRAVQERPLFDDAKTFVDAVPTVPPEVIVERYLDRRNAPDFDLAAFVDDHFDVPEPITIDHADDPVETMEGHIERRWGTLTRRFDTDPPADGTLISLPNPHVVPGGRFREIYYWDSYFMVEGLVAAGHLDTVSGMVDNVASLLDRFGFVPLGNRVYYDSRSQVPVFYLMLQALEHERGFAAIEPYLDRLRTEHAFWMTGTERLPDDDVGAVRRTVALPDGAVANRYWDGRAKPRPESYVHDRALAAQVPADHRTTLFRNLRAACESGWDFSSRWLDDPGDLGTIHTTELVPVDLNAVLYGMEASLSTWLDRAGDTDAAEQYAEAADGRREVIESYCWDDDRGFYADYRWTEGEPSDRLSLAGVVPLFTGAVSERRAERVAERLREEFLVEGGLTTTLVDSGQQWDHPNGWAPLHWMAVVGLKRYDHDELADEVSARWQRLNRSVYDATGDIAEKYDVVTPARANGRGEYELQYGFGWTNGVILALDALSGETVSEARPS